jgi:hypothetical protein
MSETNHTAFGMTKNAKFYALPWSDGSLCDAQGNVIFTWEAAVEADMPPVFFVDLNPEANWGHECLYLIHARNISMVVAGYTPPGDENPMTPVVDPKVRDMIRQACDEAFAQKGEVVTLYWVEQIRAYFAPELNATIRATDTGFTVKAGPMNVRLTATKTEVSLYGREIGAAKFSSTVEMLGMTRRLVDLAAEDLTKTAEKFAWNSFVRDALPYRTEHPTLFLLARLRNLIPGLDLQNDSFNFRDKTCVSYRTTKPPYVGWRFSTVVLGNGLGGHFNITPPLVPGGESCQVVVYFTLYQEDRVKEDIAYALESAMEKWRAQIEKLATDAALATPLI